MICWTKVEESDVGAQGGLMTANARHQKRGHKGGKVDAAEWKTGEFLPVASCEICLRQSLNSPHLGLNCASIVDHQQIW